MNSNLRLTSNRLIKFDEKPKDDKKTTEEEDNKPGLAQTKAPEGKPLTASIQDVLASYAQGTVKFVSTTGSQIPEIDEGVSEFEYEGSEVTTYVRDGHFSLQIRGNANPNIIRKKLPDLIPHSGNIDAPGAKDSKGVNGEIDENVKQGGTGDCWILTGVLALNSTETGKQIIKNSIQSNSDGSVTVTFKGLDVSYTISAEEIKKHDTDNIKNDAYSNGDNDMLVLELATKKLMADIASGKIKLDVPADSPEAIYNEDGSIEGGFAQNMIYYLTGQTADFIYAYGQEVQGLPQNEVLAFLADAYKNGNTALTFGVYGAPHHATLIDGTPYKLDIDGGHALAITNITETTVTFVNPWNSSKEYTMAWGEFAKLGIGMLSATDLSGLNGVSPNPVDPNPEVPINPEPDIPVTPVIPTPDGKIYTKADLLLLPQSLIDKFFVPYGFEADGTTEEWVLKPEYTDIKITRAQILEFEDGSAIARDLCISVKSLDENGNEVKTVMQFFSEKDLDSYLGGAWWRMFDSRIEKYFEYDEQSGLYMLKEGIKLEDLKKEAPHRIEYEFDMADPRCWELAVRTSDNTTLYPKTPVEQNLSEGIIERFFEPELNENGDVLGYTLKAPYTGFKLVSNGETEKVYEFSYKKDGIKYISTVTIDETDGSYRIKNSTEKVV